MRIGKTIEIDMGHVLPSHLGFCSEIHGHRVKVECFFEGSIKDDKTSPENGMVTDFSVCKKLMMEEIHDVLDHGFAVWDDREADKVNVYVEYYTLGPEPAKMIQKIYTVDFIRARNKKVLVLPDPPTAEVLAKYFFEKIKEKLYAIQYDINKAADEYVKLVEIRWHETPNNVAIILGE